MIRSMSEESRILWEAALFGAVTSEAIDTPKFCAMFARNFDFFDKSFLRHSRHTINLHATRENQYREHWMILENSIRLKLAKMGLPFLKKNYKVASLCKLVVSKSEAA